MNRLCVSQEVASSFLEDKKANKYVPSISYMFECNGSFMGVDNSRQLFQIEEFDTEKRCIEWLEESYNNHLRESRKDFPALKEWMTIQNLRDIDTISSETQKHGRIRKKLYKGENIVAKLVNTSYDAATDCMTYTFTTPATMRAHEPGYEPYVIDPMLNFKKLPNPSQKYTMMIQIIDFLKWLKDTRPSTAGKITWKDIKEVLDVAYVRVWCNCLSFQFFGKNYRIGQFDASLYPTTIPDKKMRSRFGDYDLLCKHLGNLLQSQSISFFLPQIASAAQKVLREQELI